MRQHAVRTVGKVSSRVCQVPAVSQGQVLQQGVSIESVARRASVSLSFLSAWYKGLSLFDRYWCSAREPGEPSSQLSAQSIATAAALIDRYLATNPSINATARSPAEARQIAEAAIRRAPLGDPAIAALLVEAAARTGVTPEVAATALAGARSGTLRALVAGHRRRPAPPQNEDDDRDETEDLHDPTAHDAAIEIAGDDSQPLDLLRGSPDIEDDLGL